MNLVVASFGNFFTGGDLLIILFIVLLLFGSKKLPELARGMGQAVREFNKAKDELERELTRPAATTEVTVQPAQGRQEHTPAIIEATPAQTVQAMPAAPAPTADAATKSQV